MPKSPADSKRLICHSERSIPSLPSRTPPILSFRTQRPFPLSFRSTARNLNSLHPTIHRPQIPPFTRNDTSQILPSRTQHPFPCHPERSIKSPCHSRTQPPPSCHSERPPIPSFRTASFCHSEHSEESKLIAHPPFTDLRFLPSLETTRAKFCHPERSIPSLSS